MQMIRGTSILLGEETVPNVLIGEPSAEGKELMLAIPKGDTHDWADTYVCFRGREWRTIGLPQEGMEENIPLCWNKKVRVRLMESTGGVTVYEADSFTRHFFSLAEYKDLRGKHTDRLGAQTADGVSVLIYSCSPRDGYRPRAGDLMVNGECSFVFDNTTQHTQSESLAQFRSSYPSYAVIKSVTTEKNGLLDDILITG